MRVVALVSGGKDSCFNMMQCVAAGHEIVALANLQPGEDQYEIDSYMYQTVGHDGIYMYSDAMGLPLFRRKIGGDALVQEKEYSPTEGDEVEDLFCLLTDIKAEVDFDAISVGAILSDYQRIRVENVCTRLGCVSLAYLWRRDQTELLQEMIDCGINAIIVKTASLGLDPDVHLGQTIAEMKSHLIKSKKKYGINVCGEGGEYETFTLDCPLFRQAIVLDEYEKVIHSNDAFAPVGFLKLNRMHLVKKTVLSKSKSSSSASASASGPSSTPSTPIDEPRQQSQGQEELQPETEKPEPEPEPGVTKADTENPDTEELEASADPEDAIVQENDAESPVTPVAADPPSQTDSPTARLSPIFLLSQSQLLEGVPVKTPLDYLSDLIECHIVDCCDGHVELCNQNHGQKEEEDEDDDASPTEDPRHSNPRRRQSEMPSSSSTCEHGHHQNQSQQHPNQNQNQASNHHYPQNQNQPQGAIKILGRRTLTSSQSCSSILSQNQDSVSTPQESSSSVPSSTASVKPQSTSDIEKELEESLNPLLTSQYSNSNSNSNSVIVNNSNLSSPMAPSPTPMQSSSSAQPTPTTVTTPPTQSIQSSREKLYVPVSQRITQNAGGWFWIMGIHDRELLSQSKIIKKSSERQQLQHQQSINSNSSSSGPPLTPNPMKNALDSLLRTLEEKDLRVSDLVSVVIYVSDMSDYAQYNKEYLTVFSTRPPVRICVEAPLPLELPVLVEALAFRNDNNASLDCDSSTSIQCMHVQGISHWAPANIGPYSQAVWVGDILYVAGQIGLVPGSMTLVDGGARIECKLALRHISRVIKAVDSKVEMRDVVQGICYVTDAKFIEECRKEWEKRTNNAIVEYLVVPRLPRDASVEWQVWAHKHNTAFEYEETGCYIGADIKVRLIRRWSYECRCAVIVCTALICNAGARFGRSEMIEMAEYALNKLNQTSDDKTQECAIRVFYRSGAINPSDIDEILGNQSSKYNVAFTIIPVCLLVKENAIISFCGVRHR